MVQSVSWLGRFCWRCVGRRRKQRIDRLMSKSRHSVMHKITANHAFGEPLLILLINHAAIGDKILLAPSKEFAQRDLLFAAATFCMANTNKSFRPRKRVDSPLNTRNSIHRQLDFPDADSAITSVLLQYAGFPVCQSQRQLITRFFHTLVQVRVAAPTEITR